MIVPLIKPSAPVYTFISRKERKMDFSHHKNADIKFTDAVRTCFSFRSLHGFYSILMLPTAALQVLMECKDERGVQKFFAMPAMVGFSEVLQRLNTKYGRPVTFVFEAEGHQCTVKNAKDLRRCWDSVEVAYRKSGSSQKTAHLDAYIVDFDASKQEASSSETAVKVTLSVPLKTKRPGEKESALGKLRRGANTRDPVASIDFQGKHQWIDEMMKALGAPTEGEPATMQGRWDKMLQECKDLDSYGTGTVTCEGFRNALTRTEPRMSVDQTEWFVRDAGKVCVSFSFESLSHRLCSVFVFPRFVDVHRAAHVC